MVLESTVLNTELSEFFGPHRVPGRELSELLSAYYLCVKANSPSFSPVTSRVLSVINALCCEPLICQRNGRTSVNLLWCSRFRETESMSTLIVKWLEFASGGWLPRMSLSKHKSLSCLFLHSHMLLVGMSLSHLCCSISPTCLHIALVSSLVTR